MEAIGVLFLLLIVAVVLGIKTITNLIYICAPNEVLVFSGSTARAGDRRVGYKLIKGGRGVRIPLLETVDRLELTNLVIDVNVQGAYSKGGIPLNVQAVANVKIAGDEPVIHNAIERLLGKTRADVMKIAKETLEGNLRGVLATLTPEQVNEDKMAFAHSLLQEAEHDLTLLGLTLDTLKIQNVTDDQGYLQAIGRKQTAEMMKRARIAEATAKSTAVVTSADNEQQTALAQIEAQAGIAKAEADRRIVDATTKRSALVAEQQAEVASMVARSRADLNVQRARIDQVQRQLQAEVIQPAAAQRDRMVFEAQGAAATIVEDARARARSLDQITATWDQLGDDAKQVLMMQKLEPIVDIVTSTIHNVKVDNLTMIDSDVSRVSEEGTLPMRAISTLEQIRRTTGVDLAEVAKSVATARK